MARKNSLTAKPPYAVEKALRRLGGNLRTARLRRNLTIDQVSEKIGTGRRAVMDAEKGKAGASVAVYVALLWAYDLQDQLNQVADPAQDVEGIALAATRERARAPIKGDLSSDF
jgi:transcriptional regulator with XRE-family HTH domain